MIGRMGRSNAQATVRQACACARPMKAYPTMPTPIAGEPF